MLVASYLRVDDAVSKSDGSRFEKIFMVREITWQKGYKTASHIMIDGNDAFEDIIIFIGLFDLSLNGPQVVVHHFLA